MTQEFDIIIPVGKKDIDFLPRVVDHLDRCFPAAGTIYVLTAAGNIPKLQNKIKQYERCTILDENNLIPSLNFKRIKDYIETRKIEHVRVGWYMQQFLKLGFAQSKYCREYYLSWDADTLPLAPIEYFKDGHPLFNPKYEYNPNYFKTIERLFGFGKVCDYSFIAENMMFSGKIMREMLDTIMHSSVEGQDWIEKILNACDFKDVKPAFSEFETYGTYCYVKHSNMYQQRFLNVFRSAGFISGRRISEKKLRLMSIDLDMASFEWGNEPMFPYNWPHILRKVEFWLKGIFCQSPRKSYQLIYDKLSGNKYSRLVEISGDTIRLPRKK